MAGFNGDESPADDDRVVRAADLLSMAYATHIPIDPLTTTFPGLELEAAYAVQQRQVRSWLAQGRIVKGFKVGLTSAVMQEQFGVHQPDYGVLSDDMFHDGIAPIPVNRFLQPRLEPEVAIVLGRDLSGPGLTVAEVAAAVDHVMPALEIIDSRIRDWQISIVDTVSDNASSGGVVLGRTSTRLSSCDLRLVTCVLYRNGQAVATGAGAAVLGNPLVSLTWLANTLGRYGVSLRAGQVVLSGSMTSAHVVTPGDFWTADMEGLGVVAASFEGAVT